MAAIQELQKSPTDSPQFHRLSTPPIKRISLGVGGGAAAGIALGLSHGSTMASLVFRAENAHRLPTSKKGWYLYHRSKNYSMMLGGLKEGLRTAGRIGFWTGAFLGVEESIDQLRRGRTDFSSTLVASLTVAGAFSLWSESEMVCGG